MAISASQIATSDTLEKFRQEFNKLRTDVNGLDAGTISVANFTVESSDFANDGFKVTFDAVDLTANRTLTAPDVTGTLLTTANSDAGTTTTSSSDADHVLVNDGGVLKKITPGNLGIGGAPAADDITTGDDSVTIATSTGNITIDAQGTNTDIIFKGTDDGSDITALTLDMSDAGKAVFNAGITVADGGTIGSATAPTAMTVASTGIVTFADDIVIKDTGTIGSASDTDAITIAASGKVTLSQAPEFTLGSDATADVFYRSSGGEIARLGIGSAGQVLKVNSGATAPEWGANTGQLVLIDSQVASSGDSELDVTGLDTSTYQTYLIVWSNMHPATDDDDIEIRLGDAGGVDTGAADYTWAATGFHVGGTVGTVASGNTPHYNTDSSDSRIGGLFLTTSTDKVGNSTGEGWSASAWLNAGTNLYPTLKGHSCYRTAQPSTWIGTFGGQRLDVSMAVTTVRFEFVTGNIDSGRCTVYGVKYT
tara:strand:- start:969 stop:2408 length:1440 start_codon:yes stop_codon:yes gene_type:complete